MVNKVLDIYSRILKYDNNDVRIAFDTNTSKPYFHAKQVCVMLKYNNYKKALRNNVNKNDIFHLKDIVKNYKKLYNNVQGNTKFLNESGFLKLILKRGDDEIIDDIFNWITEEVIPSIRQYGNYRVNNDLKKKLDELNELLGEKEEEINILKHNLKKTKHLEGGAIYIMRPIFDKISLDLDEEIYIKIGRTKDMGERENNYNTCVYNKIQIIKKIYVDDPMTIEKCIIKKMSNYKIKDRKEYFKCSYNQIINAVYDCVYCYEGIKINKEPDDDDENKLSRTSLTETTENTKFDIDKKMIVKFLNSFDDCENSCDDYKSSSSEISSSDDEDDNSDEIIEQTGGNINYKYEYFKINKKYVELCIDLI